MSTLFQEKAKALNKLSARPSTKISNFSALVYNIVRKIPQGEVLTYKQVADKIGRPKAYRAVGNALNKNRSKDVPCHRVIRSDGSVGGYNLGTAKKIALLKKEKAIEWGRGS